MEMDPSSAPQIVDSSSNPPMDFRSGAVPDQYESYPEVMPPQGLGPASAYPQPSQSGGAYDKYQPVSPQPTHQDIQNMQPGQYNNAPMAVEAEKTYYQPTYGVSQPPPMTGYSNTNTNTPYPDANVAAPAYENPGTLPPPAAYNGPPAEKKILGLKKKTFWIVLVVLIIVIIGAVGGAVGGILSSKNKKSTGSATGSNAGGNNGTNGGNNGTNTNNGGSSSFTPFALTTGIRTLNLKYQQNSGSCNDPQNADGSGLVNCFATSKYTVRVDGSVKNGYTLSSVNVQGSTFSNIRGTPPTTSDPNQVGSGWIFEVSFTQGGTCGTNRLTRYVLGVSDDIYAIGE
ncbi:hypothetical protein ABW20_dc0110161 [Dactylellina cionopaga]|nr:hypothetical protein ABW20_dc0110161 [Dactylellina cionopaga]